MKVFLIIVIIVLACIAFKYYFTSVIFSVWMVEKGYEPPTDEDIKRLAKWVAQKISNKKIK